MNEVEFYLEDLKSKFSKINPNEYYLAYSGGRDSHFLLWFIKEYLHETRIPIVFSNTGMEIPEIRDRGLANADVVLKPAMKHAEIKEKYGIPLNTKNSDEWVYMYQEKIYRKGMEEDELSNYLKWVIFHDTSYAPKGREGMQSFVRVNEKTVKALRQGLLHKVSPYCCKYLKKVPGKLYVEREREREEKPCTKYSGLWVRSHSRESTHILLAFQKMAHSILYGILQKNFATRLKNIAGFLCRQFIGLYIKRDVLDALTGNMAKDTGSRSQI